MKAAVLFIVPTAVMGIVRLVTDDESDVGALIVALVVSTILAAILTISARASRCGARTFLIPGSPPDHAESEAFERLSSTDGARQQIGPVVVGAPEAVAQAWSTRPARVDLAAAGRDRRAAERRPETAAHVVGVEISSVAARVEVLRRGDLISGRRNGMARTPVGIVDHGPEHPGGHRQRLHQSGPARHQGRGPCRVRRPGSHRASTMRGRSRPHTQSTARSAVLVQDHSRRAGAD